MISVKKHLFKVSVSAFKSKKPVENSLYWSLSIVSLSKCCSLSVDDAQQCDFDIIISCGSIGFSQSHVKVSANLTNAGSLTIRQFDLVCCWVRPCL